MVDWRYAHAPSTHVFFIYPPSILERLFECESMSPIGELCQYWRIAEVRVRVPFRAFPCCCLSSAHDSARIIHTEKTIRHWWFQNAAARQWIWTLFLCKVVRSAHDCQTGFIRHVYHGIRRELIEMFYANCFPHESCKYINPGLKFGYN